MTAVLEHANITVSDVHKTAAWMADVFGWHIRWEGDSIHDGYSLHIGGKDSYLALYAPPKIEKDSGNTYVTRAGLNHLAVTVDDLDATEERVKAAGFSTNSHADYEPGSRFYFDDNDGIEFEIVSYSSEIRRHITARISPCALHFAAALGQVNKVFVRCKRAGRF